MIYENILGIVNAVIDFSDEIGAGEVLVLGRVTNRRGDRENWPYAFLLT